jgi:hypothetical protein
MHGVSEYFFVWLGVVCCLFFWALFFVWLLFLVVFDFGLGCFVGGL